jgi:TetR/AcrR family transcriptional repressor of nem operon
MPEGSILPLPCSKPQSVSSIVNANSAKRFDVLEFNFISLDIFKATGHIVDMPKPNVRDKLLAASLATLHGKGFNATSVQDITEAAGVPKGSFYNHFASKENLGAEVLKLYSERTGAAFKVLGDMSIAPLQRLRLHLKAMIELASGGDAFCGCLIGNFGSELSTQSPLIRAELVELLSEWTAAVAAPIAAAQQSGEVPTDLPSDALAKFIVNAWQGALVRSKVEQDRAPLELFLTVVFAKILR